MTAPKAPLVIAAVRVKSCTHKGWTPGAWVTDRSPDDEMLGFGVMGRGHPCPEPHTMTVTSAMLFRETLARWYGPQTVFEVVRFQEIP